MAVAKRELGRTGLQVTTLGYGAMELRGAPRARDITEAQAETILNKVLEAGINYIDTSIDYGLSEERIGRYISHRRAEYYLASKCGCLVGAPPAPRGQRGQHVFTRDNVVAGVEHSLRDCVITRSASGPRLCSIAIFCFQSKRAVNDFRLKSLVWMKTSCFCDHSTRRRRSS
jgi:predicted oxidoreductase